MRSSGGFATMVAISMTACAPAWADGPDSGRWTIIHAGTLLPEAGRPSLDRASLILRDDRVESVRAGFVSASDLANVDPDRVTIIELGDKFVMAGLIDAHVHLGARSVAVALAGARSKVMEGSTTVRDAASDASIIFPAREVIERGLAVGPRILASGEGIGTTGGHGDWIRNGNPAAAMQPPPYYSGICDGPDTCRAAARRQIQLGADQIKIVPTAGVGDDSNTGIGQQMTDGEIQAVVEASHLMQRKVMAHAIGLTGIRAAARFGVDSIEHGNELDEETAKLMAAKGTYLVPTIYASYDILRRIRAPGPTAGFPISQNTRDKMLALPEAQPGGMCRQVRVAVKFGVKIGVGSDFGSARDEARLLVELCGFTPDRALRAATIDNAELLGISTLAGSLSAGKSADVIAFAADPRKDIAALTSPVFVMARGEVLKPATASRR